MNAFNPDCREIIAERKRNSNTSVKKQSKDVNSKRARLRRQIESRIDDLLMKRLESNKKVNKYHLTNALRGEE